MAKHETTKSSQRSERVSRRLCRSSDHPPIPTTNNQQREVDFQTQIVADQIPKHTANPAVQSSSSPIQLLKQNPADINSRTKVAREGCSSGTRPTPNAVSPTTDRRTSPKHHEPSPKRKNLEGTSVRSDPHTLSSHRREHVDVVNLATIVKGTL